MKTFIEVRKVLEGHKEEMRQRFKIKEIGVFGSFVQEEQKKTSDVDILVEFEEVPDLFRFLELEIYLEGLLELKVDLVRKKAIRKELREAILNEVVMI